MKLEQAVSIGVTAALGVSAALAFARHEEEFARRLGLKGTSVVDDHAGKHIEYDVSIKPGAATIIFESGLGSPLESWDWIWQDLRPHFTLLRYHRSGIGRSTSRLRPAQMIELLLSRFVADGPVLIVSHSIGAVIAANAIAESDVLRSRLEGIYMVDATDAELLGRERNTPASVGQYHQMTLQELLSAFLGTNRWTVNKIERDVAYLPDPQRAYVVTSAMPRTLLAAQREYDLEAVDNQSSLASLPIARHVLAASDNVKQQQALASRLDASFHVIAGSSHRSILGKPTPAASVSEIIRQTGVPS
uniref:alpha/beta hydrolase n=1 Tax=Microbacterium azadirachtae TaxID=582680 RepID=UPI000AD220FF|nr:alpha/beta hydrolase [Microbacterium azadirachtae]